MAVFHLRHLNSEKSKTVRALEILYHTEIDVEERQILIKDMKVPNDSVQVQVLKELIKTKLGLK